MRSGDERRRLLARTEQLLEAIEELNLQEVGLVPEQLVGELLKAAATVEAAEDGPPFRRPRGNMSTAAAQGFVFRLQDRLLSERVPDRPPASAPAQGQVRLLLRQEAPSDAVWSRWVEAQAQRGWDRWQFLEAQARRAEQEAQGGLEADEVRAAKRRQQATQAEAESQAMTRAVSEVLGRRFVPRDEPLAPSVGTRLEGEGVRVDLATGRVRGVGEEDAKQLTGREAHLLSFLVADRERPLSREAMTRSVLGDEPRLGADSRAIDVHVHSIRRKLGPLGSSLVSVPRVGYEWVGAEAQPAPVQATPRQLLHRVRQEVHEPTRPATTRIGAPRRVGSR